MDRSFRSISRSRWAAVGAAVAVAVGAGGLMSASASIGSGERAVYVPITPCRVMDTRPATDNVGPRNTPIDANESYAITVRGTNGNCVIPADAAGLVMNVAAIAPTAPSFLTVFPSDVTRPLAANLNWLANDPPLSNAVTTDISADGRISFYNLSGSVHISADIVGYFVDHNHDDRTTVKSVSFPAESLNIPSGSAVVSRNDGVTWTYSLAGTADLFLHRPVDFVPSSPVTLKLFFMVIGSPPSGSTVQFFARPRDFNSGDPWGDTPGVASNVVSLVVDPLHLYQTTIVLPANSLPKQWWGISIQRNQPIAGGFTGPVQLKSIEMSYTGYVVAPGS